MGRILQAFERRRWLPTVLSAVMIFILSSIPELGVRASRLEGCDKILHFVEYFILGWAIRYWSRDGRLQYLAGGIGFAALDELHQSLVPNRIMSFWDFVADVAGVTAGFMIAGYVSRRGAEKKAGNG